MIISNEYKFVYYDIPKTASTSLDYYFRKNYNGIICLPAMSQSYRTIKHNRTLPDEAKDYIKIASVRNPYHRAVSCFFYLRHLQRIYLKKEQPPALHFDSFLDHIIKHKHSAINVETMVHSTQTEYLRQSNVTDYIALRIENIEDELKKLPFYKSNVKFPVLHYNKTIDEKNQYTPKWFDMYTNERREKIIEWANEDFENFGYEK